MVTRPDPTQDFFGANLPDPPPEHPMDAWMRTHPELAGQLPPIEFITPKEKDDLSETFTGASKLGAALSDYYDRMGVSPEAGEFLYGEKAPWRKWEDRPYMDWGERVTMKPSTKEDLPNA